MTPRLFFHVVSMEFRKLLTYRASFWVNAVAGFIMQLVAAYFVWQAVFRESGQIVIGGYTFPQMVTYYVLVILIGRMVRGPEFGAAGISDEIYQGTLTRYLVYPTRTFTFKLAQHIGQSLPAALQLLLLGGISFTVLRIQEHILITPLAVVTTLVMIAAANLLHFLIHWSVESISFWQDSVWSLNVMLRFTLSLLGGAMLPLSVFPDWAKDILAWLPFQYLYAFPINILMGRVSLPEFAAGLALCLVWSAVFALPAYVIWQRGLKQYTGVGM